MWGEDLKGCILFYISQDHKINKSAMNEWMNEWEIYSSLKCLQCNATF